MNVDLTWLDYQKDVFFNFPGKVKYKVIPKGRRAGLTRGGANAFIKKLLKKEGPLLWGDTINGNIQRYYDRYFLPVLRSNNITHRFDAVHKKLEIGNQYADFRSEDNPENWEGFGYKFIFLNEAGIILKNRSLYANSVLPMLLDHADSQLVAAGVPKGKLLRDASEHPFWTLAKRAESGNKKYLSKTYTSYDNPLLSAEDIRELELEIEAFSPEQVRQEIYGEFIESDALNPFAHAYKKERHEATDEEIKQGIACFNPARQIIISIDFNLNPFAVTFRHYFQDNSGHHYYVFDEAEINNGSVPAMVDLIRLRYGRWLHAAKITGDSMGKRRDIGQRDHASSYKQLIRGLGMSESQLIVPNNPTHENSRADVNYVLVHFPDYKINPHKCPNLCRDMKVVQWDDLKGEIVKRDRKDANQRADFLDTDRNAINTFLSPRIDRHQKTGHW